MKIGKSMFLNELKNLWEIPQQKKKKSLGFSCIGKVIKLKRYLNEHLAART
jgi:hypothetical protein